MARYNYSIFVLFSVYKAKKSEMDWALKRQGGGGGDEEPSGDNVVRLRGLPYQATKQDIVGFFDGEIRIRQKLNSPRVHFIKVNRHF